MNKVIIFSAPSGSGKTTLVKYALELFPQLHFSVSAATRAPRGQEKNGEDYFFLSVEEFQEKIQSQDFVEYEEVYHNSYYGTLKSEVERIWNSKKIVIFDVDVKGGVALKNYFQTQALSIFIMPPSVKELERRLLKRATDSLETIQTRLEKAQYELGFKEQFDVIIINDDLEIAKKEIEKVIQTFISS